MAMWGGRFGAETDKELAKFSESISYDRRLYPYDIAGSKAHVKMLGATGIIPVATAKAIEDGLEEILHLIQDGKFTFKQELEDIHMNIESALIDKLGPEGARLHSARSRFFSFSSRLLLGLFLLFNRRCGRWLLNIHRRRLNKRRRSGERWL